MYSARGHISLLLQVSISKVAGKTRSEAQAFASMHNKQIPRGSAAFAFEIGVRTATAFLWCRVVFVAGLPRFARAQFMRNHARFFLREKKFAVGESSGEVDSVTSSCARCANHCAEPACPGFVRDLCTI